MLEDHRRPFGHRPKAIKTLLQIMRSPYQQENKKLFNYNDDANGQFKHREKAVKNDMKKLRKSVCLEKLEYALKCEDPRSNCVIFTVPEKDRTDYGGQMKSFPHFNFCKLWRFPSLETHHQLRPVSHCDQPFNKSLRMTQFCINPYHYELIEKPKNHRVLVPKLYPNAEFETFQQPPIDLTFNAILECGIPNATLSYEETLKLEQRSPTYCNKRCSIPNINGGDVSHLQSPKNPSSVNSFFSADLSEQGNNVSSPMSSELSEDMEVDMEHSAMSFNDFDASSPEQIYEQFTKAEGQLQLSRQYPHGNNAHNHKRSHTGGSQGSDDTSISSVTASSSMMSPTFISTAANNVDTELPGTSLTPNTCSPSIDISIVEYMEQPFWCTITYYEMNKRVGDIFHVSKSSIVIDAGFSPTDEDRLCLGQLVNHDRTQTVNSVLKSIGNGARIYNIGGEIYCECLSAHAAVFIQSPSTSAQLGWNAATVVRIPAYCNLKVFSLTEFEKRLKKTVQEGYRATYELMRFCTIRMSFANGWGHEHQRQDLTNVPCWIEIHITGPLDWLDRVMSRMGVPQAICSSTS